MIRHGSREQTKINAISGTYHYPGMLGPKLGAVPVLIPLAWFMMIYPSYLISIVPSNLPENATPSVAAISA